MRGPVAPSRQGCAVAGQSVAPATPSAAVREQGHKVLGESMVKPAKNCCVRFDENFIKNSKNGSVRDHKASAATEPGHKAAEESLLKGGKNGLARDHKAAALDENVAKNAKNGCVRFDESLLKNSKNGGVRDHKASAPGNKVFDENLLKNSKNGFGRDHKLAAVHQHAKKTHDAGVVKNGKHSVARDQKASKLTKDETTVALSSPGKPPDAGSNAPEEVEKLRDTLSMLKFLVPVKNVLTCYLLGPVVLGECRSERFCVPWMNVLFLAIDVAVFTGHLALGIRKRAYREQVLKYNFYILLVFWSMWNLCSHPLCRQHVVDLFVAPPEIHVTINIAAIAVCSSTVMAPPSMRHLIGLVTWEFFISLALSSVEVMNFSVDSSWLAVVRLDIVMFNVAILLIGSTIILGTMTVEKDIKSLAQEMESRLGPGGSFEDDLERRKRAVLTALCDAVVTTNASFVVTGSDEGADRVFLRPMLNECLTDFFKNTSEKEKFLAAVKKQFPEDNSVGEGPKRMRVTLRDDNDEPFEVDIVVSDASTDANGKVNKYMVGMHIRGEVRARALDDSKQRLRMSDKRGGGSGEKDRERDKRGEERRHALIYAELNNEILCAFDGVLQYKPAQEGAPDAEWGAGVPTEGGMASSDKLNGDIACSSAEGSEGLADGGGDAPSRTPRYVLRRATCEVFKRRSPALASRAGERHGDLRRLSLPEPPGMLT